MAVDEKISQLPEALTIAEDDYVPIVQASSGLNKKAKVSAFVPDPSFIENIVFLTSADVILQSNKINWVTPTVNHTILLPTANISYLGQVIVVNNKSNVYTLTVQGSTTSNIILSGENSIVGLTCVTDGGGYGWEIFSMYNKSDFNNLVQDVITNGVTTIAPSQNAVFDALALKLDLDGGNANQDIDIDGFGVNAKHFKVNGTGGAGHIGLKHQSADITASASESSIGADSVGDPVWKNDGGAIDKLELQSNKTSTVTGNEASITKYLTVKGVYDWAVGLFARLTGGQLTGALNEAPTVTIASATTTNIGGANSASVDISGTTTITGFGTVASGIIRNVRFTGALTLTHNATSLILPNSTNITTQNGDTAIFRSMGSGNWVCISYKSVTALTNAYISSYDGTKLINTTANVDNFGGVYLDRKNVSGTEYGAAIYLRDKINNLTIGFGNAFFPLIYGRLYTGSNNSGLMQLIDTSNITLLDVRNGYTIITGRNTFSITLGIKRSGDSGDNCYFNFYNNRTIAIDDSGTDAINDNSSIFTMRSTTKGFLPPKMTNAQRTSIVSPAVGLMVYCTDATEGLWVNKSTGWTFII